VTNHLGAIGREAELYAAAPGRPEARVTGRRRPGLRQRVEVDGPRGMGGEDVVEESPQVAQPVELASRCTGERTRLATGHDAGDDRDLERSGERSELVARIRLGP
jgi:hypothetical protein